MRSAATDQGMQAIGVIALLGVIAIAFLIPLVAPIIGIILIVSGRSLRQEKDVVVRDIARWAILSGMIIIAVCVLMIILAIFGVTTSSSSGVTVIS